MEVELTTSEKIRLIIKMQGRTLSEVGDSFGITSGAFAQKLDANHWNELEIEKFSKILCTDYYYGFDYEDYKKNNNLTVSQQIKQILKDKGLKQVELAEKLCITKSAISAMLKKDKWSEPSIRKIAKALNVKPCIVFILKDGTEI